MSLLTLDAKDRQALLDCLSVLLSYMKDDPNSSPAILAHVQHLVERLQEI